MAIYPVTAAKPIKMGYKDPDAILDYAFLWQDWLAADEIITSSVVTVATGLTLDSQAINVVEMTLNNEVQKVGSVVTAWISGGTVDSSYVVSCEITTSAGRVDERSFYVIVKQR